MNTKRLIQICPPAGKPDRKEIDWGAVNRSVGVELPMDYRTIAEAYGPGSFGEFIWLFHPGIPNRFLELSHQITVRLDALRQLKNEVVPYGLDYTGGGLLPVGCTDNGDVIYWLTNAESGRWRIVVGGSRDDWEEFDMSLSEFLVAVLTGETKCHIFPEDFPGDNIRFSPTQ